MRPLTLRLAGFRSYRSERTVSFRSLDLVAIIGDTGAGKSSLLEAMTWALYGASTWSKKSSTDLLAHGARRMSVALEFEAAGEEWRVTRTFARSGGGGAQLECLTNAGIAKVDGVRQVDPRVEELLGLSYDVFCSCVLLPQGRFERLLKATPGEKTDTLKSILRLEQLGEARALAERHAGLLAERERELLVARGRFRTDPAADVARADAALAAVRPEQERLAALAERAAALVEGCREHEREATAASEGADRLAARRGARAAALEGLVRRASGLESALADARAAAADARAARAAVDAEHRAALAAGLDAGSLARERAGVAALRTLLERRAEAERRVAADERALAGARTALTGAAAALAEAEAIVGRGDAAAAAAQAEATRAETAAGAAERATVTLTGALDAATAAAADLTAARTAAEAAEARHAAAAARLTAAHAERDRAASAREAVLREHAAAHAGAGCAPGDPCPVCDRDLPDGFTARPAPDLDAAGAAASLAAAAADTAAAAERDAVLDHRAAADARAAAASRLTAALAALADACTAAAAFPGVAAADDGRPDAAAPLQGLAADDDRLDAAAPLPAVVHDDRPAAPAQHGSAPDSLAGDDHPDIAIVERALADAAILLRAAETAAERAATAATGALAAVTAATAERTAADGARSERRDGVARAEAAERERTRALAERREEVAALLAEAAAAASELPTLRVGAADGPAGPAGAADRLPGLEPLEPAPLDSAALDAADARLAERIDATAALDRRREAARDAQEQAAARAGAAELAMQREVVTPVAAAHAELRALAAELPDDAGDGLTDPAAANDPALVAAYAADVEARVDARVAALRTAAATARAAGERDREAGRRLVAEAGCADSRALAHRLDELRAAVLAAARERDAAAGQVPGATRLDELLARATELRAGFEALKDALADRGFVGYVVARRQRALLVHASRVLEDITGRYAFTEDFRILDRDSGLPRSPDTLSGGETFIASLALALGLVEVADRSGGDLRALFLDEGFGSLDATILDTALSALEDRARAGRLIGVISHVPTVAERIDTVLEVRSALDGSTIELLTAAEREARVLDGAAQAAAAALAA